MNAYAYDALDRQVEHFSGTNSNLVFNNILYDGDTPTTAALITSRTGQQGVSQDYQFLGEQDQYLGLDHFTTVNGTNSAQTFTTQSTDGQGNVIAEPGARPEPPAAQRSGCSSPSSLARQIVSTRQ